MNGVRSWPNCDLKRTFRVHIPLLVAFTDINDSSSVREGDPDNLAATFGPGVLLKRITLEIADESVTEGILRVRWSSGTTELYSLVQEWIENMVILYMGKENGVLWRDKIAISSELMYAILAMDSYNRGYNPGINTDRATSWQGYLWGRLR